MRTKVTFILFIFFSIHILAQDIEVKSMKIVSTSSANAGARKDNNGAPSGLVRVQLKEPDAQFSGNVLGNVEYKNGEYWVYMATGSKRLDIKHPNYLPVTVIFADYGVKKLASGTEYQMTTKANKEKAKAEPNKKGMAAIQITPSNATLSIDGKPASPESGGLYTLSLPYGTHYYSVQYRNFAINNQMVKIDKTPKTIKVDLTEYFARLSIDCQEKEASIYINDELKGVGSCEEMVIPDKYVIRVEKEGYHPLSQTVTLEDNEEFRHSFPKMDAIAGTLKVEFDPIGAEVYLDGKKVGVTPLSLDNVSLGKHKLDIKKGECKPESREIVIGEEKDLVLQGSLKMTYKEILLNEATKGNGCAMAALGYYYAGDIFCGSKNVNSPCCSETFLKAPSYDSSLKSVGDNWDNDEILPGRVSKKNILQAIEWFQKATTAQFTHQLPYGNCSTMLNLSTCYAMLGQYEDAFKWVNKCAQEYTGRLGDPYYYLAWFYYYGMGVNHDVTKAKQMAQKVVRRKIQAVQLKRNAPSIYQSVNDVLNSYDFRCMPGFYCTPSVGVADFRGIGLLESGVYWASYSNLDDE